MSLEDKINYLDYKYQFVKNNKYWDYNRLYNISINNKEYKILENDFLLNVAKDISRKTDGDFVDRKSMRDYEIPNIDIDKMKEIVIDFFNQVNPEYDKKLELLLSKTKFINYDENKPSDNQRCVLNSDGIKIYYQNDLNTLVNLAHELSHGISRLNNNLEEKHNDEVEVLSEVESLMTEDIFLEYLKYKNLQIKEKNLGNEVITLDEDIINDIKYSKYKTCIYCAYRAIDELEFKNILKRNKINNIDKALIERISNFTNMSNDDVISRIDKFINRYYPSDNNVHDYIGIANYDLKNGQQLSNESRFIYAECLVEKFNNMNLDKNQKVEFYKNYLNSAKDMSLQNVLQLFNVDLINISSFSEDFIRKFNFLSDAVKKKPLPPQL